MLERLAPHSSLDCIGAGHIINCDAWLWCSDSITHHLLRYSESGAIPHLPTFVFTVGGPKCAASGHDINAIRHSII